MAGFWLGSVAKLAVILFYAVDFGTLHLKFMFGKVAVVIGPECGYILIKRPFSGQYRAVCSIL